MELNQGRLRLQRGCGAALMLVEASSGWEVSSHQLCDSVVVTE